MGRPGPRAVAFMAAPLKAAPDAHIIDTSNMDIDEVVAKAREIIENHKESA